MSAVKSAGSYHHGNLREAAIRNALQIVENIGHEAFAMRDVATSLGVTPMALYRHFKNRRALLEAVRMRGHALLYELHKQACPPEAHPREQLTNTFREFLKFSDAKPRLFLLLYDSELVRLDDAANSAEARAYRSIRALLSEVLPHATDDELRLREIAMWSTVFGYATVRAYGLLKDYMVSGLTDDRIAQAVVQSALSGI